MPSSLISMTFLYDLQFMNITKEKIAVDHLKVDIQRDSKSFFVVLQGKNKSIHEVRRVFSWSLVSWGGFQNHLEQSWMSMHRRHSLKEERKKDLFYGQSCHWIHIISNILQSALSLWPRGPSWLHSTNTSELSYQAVLVSSTSPTTQKYSGL